MEFISLLAICLISILILKLWYRRRRLYEYCDKLPSYKQRSVFFYLSLLKHLNAHRRNVKAATIVLQMLNGFCYCVDTLRSNQDVPFACAWLAFRPFIFFHKPEAVEALLSSHTAIDKSLEYNLLHPWLGTGILTSTGNKWRSRRKLLTPSFHFRILDDFMPIFNEQSMVLVHKLLEEKTQKSHVDIAPLMTMCTLDIICETAMGVKMRAQSGGCMDYVKAVFEVEDVFMYRIFRPWFWFNTVFYCFPVGWKFLRNISLLHDFTRKIIKEKKELLLNQNQYIDHSQSDKTSQRKVFLELMLEHHLKDDSFTEEDIRQEVDTFMVEGHATTAMAISFALYSVGLLPEVQENLIREIDSIFGEDTERPVTSDDLRLMKYTECVIKETLRLYPSVPLIAREIKEDIKLMDYTIVPGTVCMICPFMLHRYPKTFPNPEKFDPERFFPENSAGRHPYAFVPFSAGPRNCIGQKFALMEEKTVLANIFRHVRVKSLDHRDKINFTPDIILRNADPLRLRIIPRKGELRNYN